MEIKKLYQNQGTSLKRYILFGVFFILVTLFTYDYVTFRIREEEFIKYFSYIFYENSALRSKVKEIEKNFYLSILKNREMEEKLSLGKDDIYASSKEFSHRERIEDSGKEYSLCIERDQSPIKGYTKIINTGRVPMKDIRIFVNNQTFYKTTKEIVASIIKEGASDKEKVFAIWNFLRSRRYNWWPSEEISLEIHSPVKFVNIYGYGWCCNVARNFIVLCRAAGLPGRNWELGNHSIAEVFYDNSWHLFDVDSETFYLKDNHIASLSEIENEPYLVRRTRHPNMNYEKIKKYLVSLYSSKETNKQCKVFADYTHDMKINLRPGEYFIHPWKAFDSISIRRRQYYPEIQTDIKWWLEGETPSFRTTHYTNKPPWFGEASFGFKPKIGKNRLKDVFDEYHNLHLEEINPKETFILNEDRTRPASILIKNRYPFCIVGAEIRGEFWPSTEEDYLEIDIIKDGKEVKRLKINNTNEKRWIYINLNDVFYEEIPSFAAYKRIPNSVCYEKACYEYSVKISVFCKKGGRYGLKDLQIDTLCQATPFSPWALKPGVNNIGFTVNGGEGVEGEIVQNWNTNEYVQEFKSYPSPIYPQGLVDIDDLCFRWRPVKDSKGRSTNSYYLIVSPRQDFLWPVSPGCEINLSGDVTEWIPPKSFFLKNHTYYWRIVAKDIFGHRSKYSPPIKFTIKKVERNKED